MSTMEQKLSELIGRTNPAGVRVYTLEELKDALAMLVLTAKIQADQLSSDVELILAEFAQKIGFVGEAAKTENLKQLLAKYFATKPLNQQLMKELQEVF